MSDAVASNVMPAVMRIETPQQGLAKPGRDFLVCTTPPFTHRGTEHGTAVGGT